MVPVADVSLVKVPATMPVTPPAEEKFTVNAEPAVEAGGFGSTSMRCEGQFEKAAVEMPTTPASVTNML